MKQRKNIVTFGKSETGKTNSEFTMLLLAEANCAKVFVSYWQLVHDEVGIDIICEDGDIAYEKVKVIQENEELFSNKHPDLMFQHVVTSRRQNEIQFDLKDLARNGLLTDLDYFIIGEIKGGEAFYFLNAAYTGHKCWASCHGSSSTEAINKLADYVTYESGYSQAEAKKMLQSLETIVFMKNFKVTEISEITGWNEEKKDLTYRAIYRGIA